MVAFDSPRALFFRATSRKVLIRPSSKPMFTPSRRASEMSPQRARSSIFLSISHC